MRPMVAPALGRVGLLGALAGGALLGLAVVLDGGMSHHWVLALGEYELFTLPPFGMVLCAVVVSLIVVWALHARRSLWQGRQALAIGIVLFSSHLMGLGAGALNPILVAIALFFAVWLLDRLRDPAAPFELTGFTAMVVGFSALALLSTIGHPPLETLLGLLAAAPKLMLALILADALDTPEKVRWAISMTLWAAALFAVVGIVQVALYFIWGFEFSLAAANYRYTYTPFGRLLRATGCARFANQYAPPLVVAALMGITLLVSAAGRGRRLRLSALVTVTVAAVVLSIVRGSWTALACGLLSIPFILFPRRSLHWIGALAGLIVVGVATGALPWLVRMVSRLSETSLIERRALLVQGLKTMFEHPLTGVGILNFGPYSPTIERHPVHNAFIQVGSELGVPALILYAALVFYVGARLIRAMRATGDRATRAGLGAVLASLIGLVIVIQGEPMAYSQFVWIFFALGEAASRTALAVRA